MLSASPVKTCKTYPRKSIVRRGKVYRADAKPFISICVTALLCASEWGDSVQRGWPCNVRSVDEYVSGTCMSDIFGRGDVWSRSVVDQQICCLSLEQIRRISILYGNLTRFTVGPLNLTLQLHDLWLVRSCPGFDSVLNQSPCQTQKKR